LHGWAILITRKKTSLSEEVWGRRQKKGYRETTRVKDQGLVQTANPTIETRGKIRRKLSEKKGFWWKAELAIQQSPEGKKKGE